MAETKNQEEPAFSTKRKPDLIGEDCEVYPKKAQKLETLNDNSLAPEDKSEEFEATAKLSNDFEVPNSNCSPITEEKIKKFESDVVAKEGDNEDEEEDDEADDDDEDGEESNGKAEVDRKGKVIMRDDKGKGKLIEEDDEDGDDSADDDDSSDDGGVSDGDSDLSDDPLAEVDLNNILPSRTRRREIHPGVYIANDLGNDDEDDDSDDSDA